LQTLPLADGYTANIVFYDAGIDKKADHYVFKVAGSATIQGWDGRPVDCWLVTADYNTGQIKSRFWFDKKSQVLVREEAPMDKGALLVKTLLPPEAGDADCRGAPGPDLRVWSDPAAEAREMGSE
jgi:hypothetical protein